MSFWCVLIVNYNRKVEKACMKKLYKCFVFQDKINALLTYESKEALQIGQIVQVPFGKKESNDAIIVENDHIENLTFEPSKVKLIEKIYDIIFSKQYVKFILFIYYELGINVSQNLKSLMKIVTKRITKYNYLEYVSFHASNFKEYIISGEPGAGKTQYIIDNLKNTKEQCIFFVPNQTILQLHEKRLKKEGINCITWSSDKSFKSKAETIDRVIKNEYTVLIGTRSAIFLPFANIKRIYVDEFHDSSFDQYATMSSYRGIYLLRLLSKTFNASLYSASATPTYDILFDCMKDNSSKELIELKTTKPFNKKNIHFEYIEKSHLIPNKLVKNIKQDTTGKTKIIVINRRGYSQRVICSVCNNILSCFKCNHPLVFHIKKHTFICHKCLVHYPFICHKCKDHRSLIFLGNAIDKLALIVKGIFPDKKILVASSDYLKKIDKNEISVEKLQEYEIIITTQVLIQGYHLPLLSQVHYINVDEFHESTFFLKKFEYIQTLYQAIGRIFSNPDGQVYIYQREKSDIDDYVVKKPYIDILKYLLNESIKNNLPPSKNMYCMFDGKDVKSLLEEDKSSKLVYHYPRESRYFVTTDLLPAFFTSKFPKCQIIFYKEDYL